MGKRYQYYTAALETLTPVHIGCGEKLTKLDYVYSDQTGTVYVLDPMKLFHGLQQYGLLNIFTAGLPASVSMTDFLSQHAVPEKAYAAWAMYSFAASRTTVERGQNAIQKFVKDAYGLPYIPGSGLKGALRTVLAADAVLRERKAFSETAAQIRQTVEDERKKQASEGIGRYRFRKDLLARERSGIETEIFYTLSRDRKQKSAVVNDCMAGLIVGDSSPAAAECLTLSQKIDLFQSGDENAINTLRETLGKNVKLTFDLTVDTVLFPFSIADLTAAGERVFSFYDDTFRCCFLDYLPTEIDPAKEMYIYLGGGTGFHHKTVLSALFEDRKQAAKTTAALLNLQFPKANHPDFAARAGISPKAIKMTEYENQLEELGLCRIRFEEKKL